MSRYSDFLLLCISFHQPSGKRVFEQSEAVASSRDDCPKTARTLPTGVFRSKWLIYDMHVHDRMNDMSVHDHSRATLAMGRHLFVVPGTSTWCNFRSMEAKALPFSFSKQVSFSTVTVTI